MTVPRHGITADRKSPEKLQFIIDNHSKMTRKEMGDHLNEHPRWIKRQIKSLIDSGKIKPKQKQPEKLLTESDWIPEIRQRAIELRHQYRKTNRQIVKILKEEFGFEVSPPTFQFWMKRFGEMYQTKEDWLKINLPQDELEKLLNDSYRISDVSTYLKDKYSVYISDDIILKYIQNLGLLSQKLKRLHDIRERAHQFSKEWLEERVNAHAGLNGLSKLMGVSTTIVQKRLNEENIKLIPHRRIWSQNLENLRGSLLEAKPLIVPEEEFHQMMLGWLFGDGNIDKNGLFVVNHSLLQLDYLYLKTRILKGYLSSIFTVPRSSFSKDGLCIGGKEQLGISCPGLTKYVEYLNPDGSKNFDKILEELKPLGWMCLFMDDGSFFSGKTVLSVRSILVHRLENKYFFGEKINSKTIEFLRVFPEYIIPGMAGKLGDKEKSVGSYWENLIPELFNPVVENDLNLSFFNRYISEQKPHLIFKVVDYYHGKGFPNIVISKDYLNKEYEKLKILNTKYLLKEDGSIRYIDVGNLVFKHFMPHMVQAKYRNVSPKDVFDGYMSLYKTVMYTLKSKRSLLPSLFYDDLMRFNGGVYGFPCGIAKAVIEMFTIPGDIIVDPCTGWGGRMLGAVSSNREYWGSEPWTETFEGLKNIAEFLNFSTNIINKNFSSEDMPDKCTLVFTSPPFIDLEIYGYSFKKEDWDQLMIKIFRYSEKSLKFGSHLVLDLPEILFSQLPNTSLNKKECIKWHTSPRSRKPKGTFYVWQKY